MKTGSVSARSAENQPDPTMGETATGKRHFEVLDGLRGVAALLVVLYHISSNASPVVGTDLVLPHAYLAVDFFFTLSGFVIGYAYDDRWARMSVASFLRARIIRLHPAVVLGALLGLVSYVLDPVAPAAQSASAGALAIGFSLALLALPGPALANRGTETHPLNGPSWTLLQEYVGNVAYALALRKFPTRGLGYIALVSGVVLLACAIRIGALDRGWGWGNMWMAPIRLCYPFVTGLLLYRLRKNLPRRSAGFLPLSLLLILSFAVPTFPATGGIKINGFYEALCVLLLFPAIVVAGAHSGGGHGLRRLCRFLGRLSYLIYITHFPLLYVWRNFLAGAPHSTRVLVATSIALIGLTIAVALMAARFWDEPIRAWVRSRMR